MLPTVCDVIFYFYLSIYLSIPKYDCIDSRLTELFSFDRSKHALAEDLRKSRLEGCDAMECLNSDNAVG